MEGMYKKLSGNFVLEFSPCVTIFSVNRHLFSVRHILYIIFLSQKLGTRMGNKNM